MKQKKSTSKKKSIPAYQSKVGGVYLTRQRIPVRIKKVTSRSVEVILTLLNKPLTMKRSTLLFVYDKTKVKKSTILRRLSGKRIVSKNSSRPALATVQTTQHTVAPVLVMEPSAKQVQRGPKGPRSQSVTSVVDPMLFAAIYTRIQINEALDQSEIGKTLANRDMGWYVAYRISVLKEKGFTFEQSETGILKVFKAEVSPNLTPEKIEEKITP